MSLLIFSQLELFKNPQGIFVQVFCLAGCSPFGGLSLPKCNSLHLFLLHRILLFSDHFFKWSRC